MKKNIYLVLLLFVFIVCGNAHAVVFGPFSITESNELPDGNDYAYAEIDTIYPITARTETNQYLITVTPNEAVLLPGSNYGIQRFGLNYIGDTNDLNVAVLNDDDTIDDKWKSKKNEATSFGPFGIFVYDESTTGNNRKNPLRLHIASNIDLDVYDFFIPNEDLYIFACHIADFTFSGYPGVESAYFAQLIPEEPDVVELSSFKAVPGNARGTVTWTTDSEIDNAGFNIYRAESKNGEYSKINDSLITAEGSATVGASYSYIDEGLQNRKIYYYKLEDVDLNGATEMHEQVCGTMPLFIYSFFENR